MSMIATDPTAKIDYQEALVKRMMETQLGSDGSARLTARQIARATGLSAVRVREVVHTLRLKGFLVGSDHNGFYLPYNGIQAEATVRHLWSRVKEIAQVARAMTKAARIQHGIDIDEAEQQKIVFGEEA